MIACSYLARLTGRRQLISLDMGGTTAKAAIVEDGLPVRTSEYEVGAGINLSSKLVKGGGHPIKLPFIDVSEIGAGGGSIVSIDALGSVRVGPHSAGAVPGPACYGTGRDEPTLTDALLVLGYLGADAARRRRDHARPGARAMALDRVVATPLGRSVEEAAHGVLLLAVATMTRAVKAVTTYRGRDPRDFTLCAFGGNGPLTGVEVARALGIRQRARPSRARRLQRARAPLLGHRARGRANADAPGRTRITRRRLETAFGELETEADSAPRRATATPPSTVTRYADVRFAGQAYELPVLVPRGQDRRREARGRLRGRARPHVRPRLRGRPGRRRLDPACWPASSGRRHSATTLSRAIRSMPPEAGARPAYFGPEAGLVETAGLQPRRAPRRDGRGPLLVDEADSTCVVPPGCGRAARRPRQHRGRRPMPDVDPITLEVVKNALASTADEMALVIMRSAYSPVVRDTLDYSTALCDRDGRIVAQGLTLAVQLGTFPTVMRYVLEELGPAAQTGRRLHRQRPVRLRRPAPARHLRDQARLRRRCARGLRGDDGAPLRRRRDRARQHRGARDRDLPGGAADPALEAGRRRGRGHDAAAAARGQHPPAGHVLGDLRAQLAACRVGERGLTALLERYGADAHLYMDELQRVAERTMRAELAALPDGVHTFTDFIDGVGDAPVPIPIKVRVEIVGDEVFVDFEGTSPQVDASVNCPVGMVYAACYCAFRGIARAEIPNCEGYMTPIHVHAPAGTVVNPVLPAACGARGVIGYRVYDAVMGALARARARAGHRGGRRWADAGGPGWLRRRPEALRHDRGARRQLGREGGAGRARGRLEPARQPRQPAGRADRGGSAAPRSSATGSCRTRVARDAIVAGSRTCGSTRVLAERATLTIRTDRRDHPPYGLEGGEPGAPSTNVVVSGGEAHELPTMPMEAHVLQRGDSFTHVSAGGGGFGDAFERDPAAVLEDVLDGKVSVAAARERYGVVVAAGEIDATSTAELRHARRRAARAQLTS